MFSDGAQKYSNNLTIRQKVIIYKLTEMLYSMKNEDAMERDEGFIASFFIIRKSVLRWTWNQNGVEEELKA